MTEFLKTIGIFSASAVIIVSGLVYLAKKVIEHFLNKDIELFKRNLQAENDKTKLQFEKEIEGYKADINLIYSKQIKLYSKKSEIIEQLYQRLTKLNLSMLDMTQSFRNITGKGEQTVKEEELQRVNKAAELGDGFFKFYGLNKIYFDKVTCKLIEELQQKFSESHNDYSFKYLFGLLPSEMTYQIAKEASERVRTEIPKLMERLEDEFRDILGVIDKKITTATNK